MVLRTNMVQLFEPSHGVTDELGAIFGTVSRRYGQTWCNFWSRLMVLRTNMVQFLEPSHGVTDELGAIFGTVSRRYGQTWCNFWSHLMVLRTNMVQFFILTQKSQKIVTIGLVKDDSVNL